ncbi:hypothetical protein CC80DRAFT_508191 [Byssothecium circinans]|uniref:Uncharacterized protein n=1 Tax=Byssothecium circinans TaxID=147558 RepID=A0A6A5TH04_9PLEO|nr:hypothetical protein CC80DRAFT_508191 [Byssothecium circinans]
MGKNSKKNNAQRKKAQNQSGKPQEPIALSPKPAQSQNIEKVITANVVARLFKKPVEAQDVSPLEPSNVSPSAAVKPTPSFDPSRLARLQAKNRSTLIKEKVNVRKTLAQKKAEQATLYSKRLEEKFESILEEHEPSFCPVQESEEDKDEHEFDYALMDAHKSLYEAGEDSEVSFIETTVSDTEATVSDTELVIQNEPTEPRKIAKLRRSSKGKPKINNVDDNNTAMDTHLSPVLFQFGASEAPVKFASGGESPKDKKAKKSTRRSLSPIHQATPLFSNLPAVSFGNMAAPPHIRGPKEAMVEHWVEDETPAITSVSPLSDMPITIGHIYQATVEELTDVERPAAIEPEKLVLSPSDRLNTIGHFYQPTVEDDTEVDTTAATEHDQLPLRFLDKLLTMDSGTTSSVETALKEIIDAHEMFDSYKEHPAITGLPLLSPAQSKDGYEKMNESSSSSDNDKETPPSSRDSFSAPGFYGVDRTEEWHEMLEKCQQEMKQKSGGASSLARIDSLEVPNVEQISVENEVSAPTVNLEVKDGIPPNEETQDTCATAPEVNISYNVPKGSENVPAEDGNNFNSAKEHEDGPSPELPPASYDWTAELTGTFLGTQSLYDFFNALDLDESCTTTRASVITAFFDIVKADRIASKLPALPITSAKPLDLAKSFVTSKTINIDGVSLGTFLNLMSFDKNDQVDGAAVLKAFKAAAALDVEKVKECSTGKLGLLGRFFGRF